MIDIKLWDRKFHETHVYKHDKANVFNISWGFCTFRTVYKRRVAYVMWRSRTHWIRSA